ncbi:hypothetical protein [Halobacteriovorax sp. ZH4_bin.1]|uniref:hypothetical protein n=1 Tax=unclassified Halobacteriovorax TaxID=2639665 RepID=UPI003716D2DE
MSSLFVFYQLSFIVAALSAAGLTQIGKHYFSRGNILEIFLLSQLAMLGNLIAKLYFHDQYSGFLFSYALFAAGKYILHRIKIKNDKKNNFMVGGYLILSSLQYLLISYFPQLDSHMSIGFFGNMVTASKFENILAISSFILFGISYRVLAKAINRRTFEISVLGSTKQSLIELFLFTIPLITSLYVLGFLYTMSFLMLPALILGASFKSEKGATITLLPIAMIAAMLGLAASIIFERISTTPIQIIILAFLLYVVKAILSKIK